MQGKHLYEYALIRVVPRVEREEFFNVGVVLCSKKEGYLQSLIYLDERKLLAMDPDADAELISTYLRSFDKICKGENDESPIARHDAASRFRWLTAVRSSVLQTSRPHIGFTDSLQKTLERLFREYVK